jgi:hypothetical protein
MGLRVSSKHLALASAVFKALLRGGFAESRDLDAGLPAEVRLPDVEPAALLVLLYIVHGQPKKVPGEVSLNILTHIAILVDKYELHEVAAAAADAWYDLLERKGMTKNEHSLGERYQFLCISGEFRWTNLFNSMEYSAMLSSEGNIAVEKAADLPKPANLLGECSKSYHSSCY